VFRGAALRRRGGRRAIASMAKELRADSGGVPSQSGGSTMFFEVDLLGRKVAKEEDAGNKIEELRGA
jgi:hypothetical protein